MPYRPAQWKQSNYLVGDIRRLIKTGAMIDNPIYRTALRFRPTEGPYWSENPPTVVQDADKIHARFEKDFPKLSSQPRSKFEGMRKYYTHPADQWAEEQLEVMRKERLSFKQGWEAMLRRNRRRAELERLETAYLQTFAEDMGEPADDLKGRALEVYSKIKHRESHLELIEQRALDDLLDMCQTRVLETESENTIEKKFLYLAERGKLRLVVEMENEARIKKGLELGLSQFEIDASLLDSKNLENVSPNDLPAKYFEGITVPGDEPFSFENLKRFTGEDIKLFCTLHPEYRHLFNENVFLFDPMVYAILDGFPLTKNFLEEYLFNQDVKQLRNLKADPELGIRGTVKSPHYVYGDLDTFGLKEDRELNLRLRREFPGSLPNLVDADFVDRLEGLAQNQIAEIKKESAETLHKIFSHSINDIHYDSVGLHADITKIQSFHVDNTYDEVDLPVDEEGENENEDEDEIDEDEIDEDEIDEEEQEYNEDFHRLLKGNDEKMIEDNDKGEYAKEEGGGEEEEGEEEEDYELDSQDHEDMMQVDPNDEELESELTPSEKLEEILEEAEALDEEERDREEEQGDEHADFFRPHEITDEDFEQYQVIKAAEEPFILKDDSASLEYDEIPESDEDLEEQSRILNSAIEEADEDGLLMSKKLSNGAVTFARKKLEKILDDITSPKSPLVPNPNPTITLATCYQCASLDNNFVDVYASVVQSSPPEELSPSFFAFAQEIYKTYSALPTNKKNRLVMRSLNVLAKFAKTPIGRNAVALFTNPKPVLDFEKPFANESLHLELDFAAQVLRGDLNARSVEGAPHIGPVSFSTSALELSADPFSAEPSFVSIKTSSIEYEPSPGLSKFRVSAPETNDIASLLLEIKKRK